MLPGPYICVFKKMSDEINWTWTFKIACGRCLVDLRIQFRKRLFLHKYIYFSSFGAGNCVSNSSFKWMKNSPKQFGSIGVNNRLTSMVYFKYVFRPYVAYPVTQTRPVRIVYILWHSIYLNVGGLYFFLPAFPLIRLNVIFFAFYCIFE